MSFPAKWHILLLFLMPVIQCIVVQCRHISSESVVALLLHLCSICSHVLIFVAKRDVQLKAWDILLVLTSVAGNLCNKCPSGYSNKTAVKVIHSMQSLVSIEQQSPRRPCDSTPPGQVHPLMVSDRAAGIQLECILVCFFHLIRREL